MIKKDTSSEDLEEKMATYSSILAWKIPWTEELGRLQSMGSQKVGHDYTHTHPPPRRHNHSKLIYA